MKTLKKSFQLFLTAIVLLAFATCKFKSETQSNSDNAGTGPSAPVFDSTKSYDSSNTKSYDTSNKKIPIGTNSQLLGEKDKSTDKSKISSTRYRKWKTSVGNISQNNTAKKQVSSAGIYEYTDVRPSYPGGEQALQDFISRNIIYPEVALDNEVEGTVNVQFTVDEKGNVTDVNSLNNLGHGLAEEAVRVVSMMPKWSAGSVKKKAVKTKVTIPITFTIEQ
jgi:periplasmic protein TonB